jgi:hypothetical protein
MRGFHDNSPSNRLVQTAKMELSTWHDWPSANSLKWPVVRMSFMQPTWNETFSWSSDNNIAYTFHCIDVEGVWTIVENRPCRSPICSLYHCTNAKFCMTLHPAAPIWHWAPNIIQSFVLYYSRFYLYQFSLSEYVRGKSDFFSKSLIRPKLRVSFKGLTCNDRRMRSIDFQSNSSICRFWSS